MESRRASPREEVECGSPLEQKARDIAAAHVAGAAERGFEVSTAPVPRGFDQSGLLVEQLACGVEISVRGPDEALNLVAGERLGPCRHRRLL
jgi:hypothetical protein